MVPSPSLLSLLLLQLLLSTSRASPSVPVSTQAIVTTITAPTVSNVLSTVQSVVAITSSVEDIQTVTTVDASGNPVTSTIDNGPSETVVQATTDVVVTSPVTSYITFESTIGESTILGPDPTTSTSAATSSPSVVNASPAPPGSTETSTYVSLGITYAPVTSTDSSSPSSTSSSGNKASPVNPYTATGSPPPIQTSGMSVGAKAAIGTAAVVACIFLAILVLWLVRLRSQRKAVAEQYPNGGAPGDEAGIFGFFSPIVGKPYEKDEQSQKDIKMTEKPKTLARELSNKEITPPAMEQPQEPPYRRPIPQRNGNLYTPHEPVSPVDQNFSPQHHPQPQGYGAAQSDFSNNLHELDAQYLRKGFHRPTGPPQRFPSHHQRGSSSTDAPQFYDAHQQVNDDPQYRDQHFHDGPRYRSNIFEDEPQYRDHRFDDGPQYRSSNFKGTVEKRVGILNISS